MENTITLGTHILQQQMKYPEATGELTDLLYDIILAAKIISREVNKAGLAEILGLTGKINVQGEEVQKLDEYANTTIKNIVQRSGNLCLMASEEEEDIIRIPEKYPLGKYVLAFDPLDGSSNIDVNVSIGTIFSIFKKVNIDGKPGDYEDILQPGYKQVAAGYVIYGSSTVFVYTSGQGVHGFTLDPSVGEFFLSHPDIKIPERGKYYSVNESNYHLWDDKIKNYVDKVREGRCEYKYTSRYIGSLVADFHRNLLKGGIFLYPSNKKSPKGKLRLLYEANPLAFIVEQAGGMAITDRGERILDIVPQELHQRVPLIIGSKDDVELFMKHIK